MQPTRQQLQQFAAARSLIPVSTLQAAIEHLGFVQADPLRAPARAQDLILMQRLPGYRAGDLERDYARLDVEEDYFPNYGFVSRRVWTMLHPRAPRTWRIEGQAPGLMARVLAHVREVGELHPREAATAFGRVTVGNAWGSGSNAATRALEALHHAGELRIVRREGGIKVYGPANAHPGPLESAARRRALLMVLARLYAPVSEPGLWLLLGLSQNEVPGLRAELKLAVQEGALTRQVVEGLPYLWPSDETPQGEALREVRLLAPFDPLVWDRRAFEHLHGWTYRFEAYTPPARRQMGHYALPLLWQGRAVGWANLRVQGDTLQSEVGLVPGVRRTATFERALKAELERYRAFLRLASGETA